jgi:hypothetical protein
MNRTGTKSYLRTFTCRVCRREVTIFCSDRRRLCDECMVELTRQSAKEANRKARYATATYCVVCGARVTVGHQYCPDHCTRGPKPHSGEMTLLKNCGDFHKGSVFSAADIVAGIKDGWIEDGMQLQDAKGGLWFVKDGKLCLRE